MGCIVVHQAPLSMGFSRQEHWSGLPLPSPGDLPDPGREPGSPALLADSLPLMPPGKPSKKQGTKRPVCPGVAWGPVRHRLEGFDLKGKILCTRLGDLATRVFTAAPCKLLEKRGKRSWTEV